MMRTPLVKRAMSPADEAEILAGIDRPSGQAGVAVADRKRTQQDIK